MPVKVKCPACAKALSVPDSARGKAVKCPTCQGKVPVPAGIEPVASAANSQKIARLQGDDGETAIATFDLSKAQDRKAKVCFKCGNELYEPDEGEPPLTECPACGIDLETGQLGDTAKRKLRRGLDPRDFYKNLWKQGWQFVMKNKDIAIRSGFYGTVSCAMFCLSAFMFCYSGAPPTRFFWAMMAVVGGLVLPGWYWWLDTLVINLGLEQKDRLKRVNFDFFLSSALGIKVVLWHLVFAGPFVGIPAYLAMFAMQGAPPFVPFVIAGIAYLPVLAMLPIAMAHMSMPIDMPGWMIWKVLPGFMKTYKACGTWLGLFLATNLPVMAGVAVLGIVSGPKIDRIATDMLMNSDVAYAQWSAEQQSSKEKQANKNPLLDAKPREIDYSPLIVPACVLPVLCFVLGFTALFNMRTNALFVAYNRPALKLIAREKAIKYQSKEGVDEDGPAVAELRDMEPKDAMAMGLALPGVAVVAAVVFSITSEFAIPKAIFLALLGASLLVIGITQAHFYKVQSQFLSAWMCVTPVGFFRMLGERWNLVQNAVYLWAVGVVLGVVGLIGIAATMPEIVQQYILQRKPGTPAAVAPAAPPAAAHGAPAAHEG